MVLLSCDGGRYIDLALSAEGNEIVLRELSENEKGVVGTVRFGVAYANKIASHILEAAEIAPIHAEALAFYREAARKSATRKARRRA
jgi:hypothetical protein